MSDSDMEAKVREMLLETARHNEAHFSAGFADRVIARVQHDRSNGVAAALAWQTRRLLPALMAASFALVAWNWTSNHASADSVLDAALGLAPVAIRSSAPATSALENAEVFQ